ncbi:MAG: hypothetical protein GYA74_04325 [Acidobacteria bacterium]|jgi:hypothetical protein|nr:hypothetical protein [Acidobacteriota bacterium]HOF83101.1 hypothetical protein [Candidatus Aminicenantes bacterium]MDD8037869.1 hypothetical protein [Acidobacteriota bacterium]NMD10381.1 hypothetical protein [Acidobacteriota bacterium]HOS11074.1 hypothetical protein [Candidatus Aminicenantes bacterium]
MGFKKTAFALILAAAVVAAASAQWRDAAARTISGRGDFRALAAMIEDAYPGMPESEKSEASGILAFCAFKTGDASSETRWIAEFFESGRSDETGFIFLDFDGQAAVESYLDRWRIRYPRIREIALVAGTGDEAIIPEGTLPLAVDIAAPVFFKFFEGEDVLRAGAFQPGFNVLGLDANALFRETRRRTYVLEVKSGSLILRKKIILDVAVSWPEGLKPKPPEPPKAGWLARALGTPDPPPPPAQPPKAREYRLSLYVGGDLLLSSRKQETAQPLTLGLKPSNNPMYLKPDWNIKRNDPWANPGLNSSFSIIDAIGLVGGLLKDLLQKKKTGEPGSARVRTVQDLALDFRIRDAEGRPLEMRVTMNLDTRERPVVRSGL